MTSPVVTSILERRSVTPLVWIQAFNATFAYAKSSSLVTTERLFVENLRELMKGFLKNVAREQATLNSADTINFFGNEWKKWVKSTTLISGLLTKWQGYTVSKVDVSKIAYSLWKEVMFGGESKDRVVAAVSNIVDQYRQGVPTNMGLVRALIDCLLIMDPSRGLVKELEKQYVQMARSFFETQVPVIQAMEPAAAVKFTDDLRIQEGKITEDILLGTAKHKIEEAILDVLVARNIDFFLSGFDGIVSRGDVVVGKSIRTLLVAARKADELVKHFEEYVKKTVRQMFEENKVDASKDSEKFVSLASEAYGRFHSFVLQAFEDDPEMSSACDKGFKESFNINGVVDYTAPKGESGAELSRQIVVPKIIAEYTHKLMTASSKTTLSPSELEKRQTDLVTLVEFLNDKATFIDQYRRNLAQRLLMNVSVGVDRESALLDKLKQINVDAVITKSHGMLNDIRTSTDFSESFKQTSSGDPKVKYSFDPLLLTSSAWPSNVVGINSKAKFSLPDVMRQSVEVFSEFYHRQYPDKKLVHAHKFDKGELVLHTPTRKYYMSASGYQVAILPLIDETGATFQALSDKTLLSLDDLKLQLCFAIIHGIVSIKGTGADKKNPSTWTADTLIVPNKAFVAKVLRFKITPDKKAKDLVMATKGDQVVGKATDDEKDEIIKGRIATIQAAIVRIMKARKKLGYQELFQQTTEQTSRWFPMDMRTFKKACEELIDQEYIKRPAGEKAYEYIS